MLLILLSKFFLNIEILNIENVTLKEDFESKESLVILITSLVHSDLLSRFPLFLLITPLLNSPSLLANYMRIIIASIIFFLAPIGLHYDGDLDY